MGTRGTVGFTADGTTVRQYQQYDSYPSGVGLDVLRYARSITDVEHVKEQVGLLRVVKQDGTPTAEEREALARWTDTSVSTGSDWYATMRHTQGRPDLILESGVIVDAEDFHTYGTMCEWSYLVDLDHRTLVVEESARVVATYDLSALPTDEEFLRLERD